MWEAGMRFSAFVSPLIITALLVISVRRLLIDKQRSPERENPPLRTRSACPDEFPVKLRLSRQPKGEHVFAAAKTRARGRE